MGNAETDATKNIDARIKKEKKKLLKIFSTIDQNKLKTVESLIDRAAFINVSLQDIESQLNSTGWVERYQNGENQKGLKKSAAADVHISLTKNLNAIVKQLLDIVPATQKDSKLMEMMRQ